MTDKLINESLLQVFLFETKQMIEQLEEIVLSAEETTTFSAEDIQHIFRIMHTIKGSSGMMQFNQIAELSHSLEDVFAFLRANEQVEVDFPHLIDLILGGIDFIKNQTKKISAGQQADGNAEELVTDFHHFLMQLQGVESKTEGQRPEKTNFQATIFFEDGCEMENIRAFNIVHHLEELAEVAQKKPENLMDERSSETIREKGFTVEFNSLLDYDVIKEHLLETLFISRLELIESDQETKLNQEMDDNKISIDLEPNEKLLNQVNGQSNGALSHSTSMISVNVAKLDQLMDIVGEIVVAEALVIQNPDLNGMQLDNFQKASRQLHKIINELQDSVLSIRMVPLKSTFSKMHRLVRDMRKKLNKDVQLQLVGEETEVDKNIIEHISDPLMHLIRNSMDHGLETSAERLETNKPLQGTIKLEARSSGGDVLIIVSDDGKGLDREKILSKAREQGLVGEKDTMLSDQDIYRMILKPGFSTKEKVTEFSGRGVGMDVALKNIESLGGEISIESREGRGTDVTIRIPLTLAIMEGMNIRVGTSCYTLPITSIRESFRPKASDLITDPDGNEMIMIRGECLKIIRLNQFFNQESPITEVEDGIMIIVEDKGQWVCLFADELLGEQQVVIKALPHYINMRKKIRGISGCTLLGDGRISLILDFNDFHP